MRSGLLAWACSLGLESYKEMQSSEADGRRRTKCSRGEERERQAVGPQKIYGSYRWALAASEVGDGGCSGRKQRQ